MRRLSRIIGAIWLALGGTVILRAATRDDPPDAVRVGSATFTAEDEHSVPIWLGIWIAAAGISLVARGFPEANELMKGSTRRNS